MKPLIFLLLFVVGCASHVKNVPPPSEYRGGNLHCLNDNDLKALVDWVWAAEKALEKYERQTEILNRD